MPNMDGSGPFGKGRPGRGMGPCRVRNSEQASMPGQQQSGAAPRFRNYRKAGLSGFRNRFGGGNRRGGHIR